MITPDQIRAARALKNWSQAELAYRTGLATPTIANIELGKQKPGGNTIKKMLETFKLGGVKIADKGVETTDNSISFIEGPEEYSFLLRDAICTLNPGEEMLLIGADFRRARAETVKFRDKLLQKGIVMRTLMHEDNIFIQGPPIHHRLLTAEHCTYRETITIYGDNVATVVPIDSAHKNRLMILRNAEMADDYRKIFKFMWERAKKLKKFKQVKKYKHPIFQHYTKQEIKKMSSE